MRTGIDIGHQLVPIFGDKRVEVNDPDHHATALFDAVLKGWTLSDTKVATLQDWIKGRRGEIDEINGLVVDEQAGLGGEAPVNRRLVEIARRIERGELAPDPANADLLRALLGLASPPGPYGAPPTSTQRHGRTCSGPSTRLPERMPGTSPGMARWV